MKMSKNTLIITRNFHPCIGGVETYIIEFIKCYIKRENSFLYILTPVRGTLPDYIDKKHDIRLISPKVNLSFVNIDKEEHGTLIQAFVQWLYLLIKGSQLILAKNDISNIYGIGGPFAIVPSYILSKLFNKRCFGHIHADFQFQRRSTIARWFYKCVFKGLDRLFVNSQDVKTDILAINVPEEKLCIIHNWIDTNIFNLKNKKTCRENLNLPLDKDILLFVGRLSGEKGILQVLDCIDILGDHNSFIFLIVGDGPLRPIVEKRIKDKRNAVFAGPKSGVELANFYNAADVLLWGSIDTHYVSIVIMEALHCGLPVLAPRTTTQDGKIGIKEYFVKDETLPREVGLLFEGDVNSLIKAITVFFSTKFSRKKINLYAAEKYSEKNANPVLAELWVN